MLFVKAAQQCLILVTSTNQYARVEVIDDGYSLENNLVVILQIAF